MGGFPILPPPTGRLSVPSRPYYRSASASPTRQSQFQQHTDSLLSQITPATVVHSLRYPAGPLKECLDTATAAEQSFAMRAALALSSLQEWIDELSQWPWPENGGSSGFEEPSSTSRRLKDIVARGRSGGGASLGTPPSSPSAQPALAVTAASPMASPPPQRVGAASTTNATTTTPERQTGGGADTPSSHGSGRRVRFDDENSTPSVWMGSLLANDVARYDARITEIRHELEDLQVEDLKQHVLHHHIFPLSRPGTPSVDGSVRTSSTSGMTIHTLDDLAAVVTAIVVQALPQLAKLVRLLDTWHIRLLVLKRIPALLASLCGAEAAMRSAWQAIDGGDDGGNGHSGSGLLPRDEFDAIKATVERKVSKAAQITDYMLDALDGWEDTIPEEWIDRIDAAEREYGKWVTVCERSIRDSEWKRLMQSKPMLAPPTTGPPNKAVPGHRLQKKAKSLSPAADVYRRAEPDSGAELDDPVELDDGQDGALLDSGADDGSPDSGADADGADLNGALLVPFDHHNYGHEQASYLAEEEQRPERPDSPAGSQLSDDTQLIHPDGGASLAGFQTPQSLSRQASLASLRSEPCLPSMPLASSPAGLGLGAPFSDTRIPASDNVTPSRSPLSRFGATLPRSGAEVDMCDMPGARSAADVSGMDIGISPPSSPPDFRASTRSMVTFNDMPTVNEVPGEESAEAPMTPVNSSFLLGEDFNDDMDQSMTDLDSPRSRRMSISSEDDQLQWQIGEILESLPAKFRLSSQPAPPLSHLNPPDLQLPRRPKPSIDSLRSTSGMSSRSGTPSFLLAPAYMRNARSRQQQRGNQDIKLYHLSRSTGEAPIKLFIRLVGEGGERVMVRVGGGWADLSEYLKEYASHHARRSKSGSESRVEISGDLPVNTAAGSSKVGSVSAAVAAASWVGSSPPSRPASDHGSPIAMSPLRVRKTRQSMGEESSLKNASKNALRNPKTPLWEVATAATSDSPPSGTSTRSRSSSRLSWTEEDSSLGMSGPRAKHIEMSEESKAWVESVKEKVRIASGECKVSEKLEGKFGEIGRVNGTKRLFRKG